MSIKLLCALFILSFISLAQEIIPIPLEGVGIKDIYSVRVLTDGTVGIISREGIHLRKDSSSHWESIPLDFNIKQFLGDSRFVKDGIDKLYIESYMGVYTIDDSLTLQEKFQKPKSFSGLTILNDSTMLTLAACGCGAEPGNILRIINKNAEKIEHDTLYKAFMTSVLVHSDTSFTVTTKRSGVFKQVGDSISTISPYPGAEVSQIGMLNSLYWISLWDTPQLRYFQDGKWQPVEGIKNGVVSGVHFYRDKGWIQFKDDRVIQEITPWKAGEVINVNQGVINEIEVDSVGNVWIASEQGLFLLRNGSTQTTTIKKPRRRFQLQQSNDQLQLTFSENIVEEKEVHIVSMSGRELYRRTILPTETQTVLPINHLTPGIYLLKVHSAGDEQVVKLLK